MTRPTLDIGFGAKLRGDFGMDAFPQAAGDRIVRHNILDIPWPFPAESFSRVYCYDVLEHLPWSDGLEHLENLPRVLGEVCRVLAEDGVFEAEFPHVDNWSACGVPTHRRYLNEWTLRYFVRGFAGTNGGGEATAQMGMFAGERTTVERSFPGHWYLKEHAPSLYRALRRSRLGRKDKVHVELLKSGMV